MARSPKSTILLAVAIAWAGVILTAIILIYLPHGPARQPKLNAIPIVMMAAMSIAALVKTGFGRIAIVSHAVLWAIALVSTVLVANSDLGEGLHPLTCPVIYLVLGAMSLGIIRSFRVPEPMSALPPE